MYDLFLQLSIFLSLGAIIYVISRALPRINDVDAQPAPQFSFNQILSALPLEKMDLAAANLAEKGLRRFRVAVLKFDNWLNYRISRVKRTNSNGRNGLANQNTLFDAVNSENGKKES